MSPREKREEKLTDEDRANYNYDITTSPFFSRPHEFLSLGQRVRAKFRIWDLPWGGKLDSISSDDWGWVSAEKGEMGTVVYVAEGEWPVVRFDDTGHATCVIDFEVEKVS